MEGWGWGRGGGLGKGDNEVRYVSDVAGLVSTLTLTLTSLSSSPTTSSSISLPSNPSSGTSIVYLWFLETLIFAEGGEETLDKSDTKEESDPVEGVERWRGGGGFSSSNDFTTFS